MHDKAIGETAGSLASTKWFEDNLNRYFSLKCKALKMDELATVLHLPREDGP